MSAGHLPGRRPSTSQLQSSAAPEKTASTAESQISGTLEPCTATASSFLCAQRNIIICLRHGTLEIEKRFEGHKNEVLLISADNVSKNGVGRLIASYDAGQIALIWDLFTGEEVAQFSSFEPIRVVSWLKNGSVAFGNDQGSIILFESSTSEHISFRTIFDPITALAPLPDSSTFAIGYANGSILIATLRPSFTILHSLSTSRGPSPITSLAWHGSSARQKTDMLASQTAEGDLCVWNVSKGPHAEAPKIVRILGAHSTTGSGNTWSVWSKNGRIVQHIHGDTRLCDVRTKKITQHVVPTVDHIVGIAAFGPSGTLFTISRNHSVQQYDLVSREFPLMVTNVLHVPPNAPPTPPDSVEESKLPRTVPMTTVTSSLASVPAHMELDSGDDEMNMSPLQKIQELEQVESERRDRLTPLSPTSSRGSLSSASSHGRLRDQLKHNPSYSDFSAVSSPVSFNDNSSSRSSSSLSSSRHNTSSLRHEIMRSPEEAHFTKGLDLFPFIKARLGEVKFRAPRYIDARLTSEILRKEMLSVVFGWDDDIGSLIRDEQFRHRVGSASRVILSKWLGDLGADTMAQLVGSESMTSSDWMLLALSCQMGEGSQKKVGEALVKRLLETGEIHPAVAILLGLSEENEAVEVYVSQKHFMEAVLLTCLYFPDDWQRQSHLVRKWGEAAVAVEQHELAVRCFSCTTIESSEVRYSPNVQGTRYGIRSDNLGYDTFSPSVSPPTSSLRPRLTAKSASLKLITDFNNASPISLPSGVGVTPIADSALTPGTVGAWRGDLSRDRGERSQSRTATPGGIGRRRFPSASGHGREPGSEATPMAERRPFSRRATPAEGESEAIDLISTTAIPSSDVLESVSQQPGRVRLTSKSQTESKNRERHELDIEIVLANEDSISAANDPPQDSGEHANILGQQRTTRRSARESSRGARTPSRPRDNRSHVPVEHEVVTSSHSETSPTTFRGTFAGGDAQISDFGKDEGTRQLHASTSSQLQSEISRSKSRSARSRLHTDNAEVQSGLPDPRVHVVSFDESSARFLPLSSVASSTVSPLAKTHQRVESRQRSVGRDANEQFDRRSPSHGRTGKGESISRPSYTSLHSDPTLSSSPPQKGTPRTMSRKEHAARELEERRLSLARRPSVPVIPHPAELGTKPLRLSPRPAIKTSLASTTGVDVSTLLRSQTVPPMRTSSPSSTPASDRTSQQSIKESGSTELGSSEFPFVPIALEVSGDLPSVTFERASANADDFGPLLPSTVYEQMRPAFRRSASAPPENIVAAPLLSSPNVANEKHKRVSLLGRGYARKVSEIGVIHEVSTSFEAGHTSTEEHLVVVVPQETATNDPPLLAELAHLATPPPPPPPPTMFQPHTPRRTSEVVKVVLEPHSITMTPPVQVRSPALQRRRTSSIEGLTPSSPSSSNGIGSKFRNVAERMRSGGRKGSQSPSAEEHGGFF